MADGEAPAIHSLLFVCMGNLCRSPVAEAIVRARLVEAGLADRVEVDSAGTHAREGEPPHETSREVAALRGVVVPLRRARLVRPGDFARFRLIVAMDRRNLEDLALIAPRGAEARMRLMMSFAPQLGRTEVPDPFMRERSAFERVMDLLEVAATGLIREVGRELRGAPPSGAAR